MGVLSSSRRQTGRPADQKTGPTGQIIIQRKSDRPGDRQKSTQQANKAQQQENDAWTSTTTMASTAK